jgi:thiol-disulfide isomerase/thioredoxin
VGFAAGWLFIAWRLYKYRPLRKPLAWAAIVGTSLWGGGLLALSVPAEKQQSVPSLALAALDGTPTELAAFRGKPMVVNLWATWCPPCVREMPVLYRAQVSNPGVNFVFINQGETAQRVAPWLSARGLPLRNVLLDSKGEALAAFNQRGLPTTLFFDAEGRLVGTRTGELSEATLSEKLNLMSSD